MLAEYGVSIRCEGFVYTNSHVVKMDQKMEDFI